MSDKSRKFSRRQVFTGAGRSATAASLGSVAGEKLGAGQTVHKEPPPSPPSVPPSERVRIALIGCGGMGLANMYELMKKPGVEVVALCDVDERHLRIHSVAVEKRSGKKPETYRDFRLLMERKDIQGVIIGTPDHWHALPLITACEVGWDIYCEKPISHDITEAKAMVAAAKKFHRIVQVGTWQRSTSEFVSAVEYIRSGKLGKITTVRAWKTDDYRMGRNAVGTPSSTLDYDLWLGPAAKQEYRFFNNDCHVNWRWYLNFGSGMTGDWGVHMIDIGLLAMSKDTDLVMPTEVSAFGGKLAWPDDDRTAPDTHIAIMKFKDPDFVLHWETGRKSMDNGPDHGTEFIAADGRSLMVWRGGWMIRERDGRQIQLPDPTVTDDHWQNWLDSIKTRQQPRASLASLYQTTAVCHLANAALLSNETIRWDKAQDDIVGRAGKDTQSYYREYRKPWKLPMHRA